VRLFVILLAILISSSASAFPDSLTMNCKTAQALVQKDGSVTLATGDLFATFFASGCPSGNSEPAFVRTRDVSFCFVGSYCTFGSRSTGSYFQAPDAPCTDGTISMSSRIIGRTGRGEAISVPVQVICKAGEWVDPSAAPTTPTPPPATCKEGSLSTSWVATGHTGRGDPTYSPIQVICHHNKWVKN
jgi:hypothetical protein